MLRRQLYVEQPNLKNLSYEQQLSNILSGFYTYAGGFSRIMNDLGNDAHEIIYNVEVLQKQWAKENHINLGDGEHWQLKIVIEQLKVMKPDVVYIQGTGLITTAYLESIQEQLPSIKLLVQYSGFPSGWDEISPKSLLLLGSPIMVQQAFNEGLKAHLVYHSFDQQLLTHINQSGTKYDFTFSGSSGFGWGDGHKSRFWELVKLAFNTPLELWLDEMEILHKQCNDNPFGNIVLKSEFTDNINYNLAEYPTPPCKLRYLLPPEKNNPSIHGIDYFQLMADSKISLHRHSDRQPIGAMRLFEATGSGTCLMTDNQENLSELFEPDKEIIAYDSVAECIEKINYLLEHEDERKKIAQAGQKRTLSEHLLQHRCEHIHDLILNALK